MMAKNVFFCRECHGFYVTEGLRKCSDCKIDLEMLDISETRFRGLSNEQKEKLREECAGGAHRGFQPIERSAWASVIRTVGWLIVTVFFLLGVISMGTGAVITGVALIFGGFATVAVNMLVADIAEDVRGIRNSIDGFIQRKDNSSRIVEIQAEALQMQTPAIEEKPTDKTETKAPYVDLPNSKASEVAPNVIDEYTVQCPLCGTKQKNDRSMCCKCGASFKA